MNKSRILIFSLAYHPFIGGAEIAIQEITKRLSDDFEFDMITCNLDGKQKKYEKINNINVYKVKNKYLFPWKAFKLAKKLYKKNNYKIVWGMMATWGGWTALKFKEKYPNVKYLLTLQSGDSDKFIKSRTCFWSWRYKQIYQKADHIQVISNWLKNRARKFGYKKEISLIPNGVKFQEKKEYSGFQKKNGRIILTVSRLVEKNGVGDLINAISKLDNVVLKIIGNGSERKKMEKLVNNLKISNRVAFLGNKNYTETQNYYSQVNIFCRPSLSEGFGNVFIEAMANQVPVIATPVGGIPDFLREGETGWFCEPKNPQSIAEKIKYILDENNKEEVAQVVSNAKKMVEEKYTWEKVSEQMKSVFNNLLV
ncbi:glycosyltransferase family 4 protein [Patescibacteria group bacterium]